MVVVDRIKSESRIAEAIRGGEYGKLLIASTAAVVGFTASFSVADAASRFAVGEARMLSRSGYLLGAAGALATSIAAYSVSDGLYTDTAAGGAFTVFGLFVLLAIFNPDIEDPDQAVDPIVSGEMPGLGARSPTLF